MAYSPKKTNKKFMLLSAIGIIMVVDSHCLNPISLFSEYMPYNSFFMPLFVFISGYFNKVDDETNLLLYLRKKENRLLLPYIVIAFTTFLIELAIRWFKTGGIPIVSLDEFFVLFISPFTIGYPVDISGPIWFLPSLFCTLIVYAVLKKLLYRCWNSLIAFSVFCIFNIGVVWISKYFVAEYLAYLPLKCLFFLPFIELGIIYREIIEGKIRHLKGSSKIILLFILIFANMIRMMVLPSPNDILFGGIYNLSGFSSPYVITPLVSSLIGILFWTTLIDIFGKAIYENRLINYISENTIIIMGFHVVFFNILNCILKAIHSYIAPIEGFNISEFSQTNYYFWGKENGFCLVYLFFGLAGPLLLKFFLDKIRKHFVSAGGTLSQDAN